MKKFSIRTSRLLAGAAVAAAALFAACTADTEDVPVRVPLRFAVSMPEGWDDPDAARSAADKVLPTRATPFTGDSFGVFAYVEGNESPYMDNVKVTKSDDSWIIEGGKSYYLPNGKSVTFYAYSPYNSELTSASIPDSITDDFTKGESLLIAGKTVSVESDFTGEIALTFSHAFSKVIFYATGTSKTTFTLNNVVTKGTLEPDPANSTWKWILDSPSEIKDKLLGETHFYYMIPYDFKTNPPQITITSTVNITEASKDRIEKWEKNKTYTYEFKIINSTP